jgi:hypothetical protein
LIVVCASVGGTGWLLTGWVWVLRGVLFKKEVFVCACLFGLLVKVENLVIFGFKHLVLWCALFVVCLLFVAFSFGFWVYGIIFVGFQNFSKIVCDYTRFFNVFCLRLFVTVFWLKGLFLLVSKVFPKLVVFSRRFQFFKWLF